MFTSHVPPNGGSIIISVAIEMVTFSVKRTENLFEGRTKHNLKTS